MAHLEPIPRDVLKSLADQIGRKLPVELADEYAAGPPPQLTESLPVMRLPLEALAGKAGRLRRRVVETGRWHHQIRWADKTRDYATSQSPGRKAKAWEIVSIGRSELPPLLAEALAWVERHAKGDPTVRLVTVDGYKAVLLWLEHDDRDEIVVARPPRRARGLKPRVIYDADDFLTQLARHPLALGIPRADE
jgi:hypothetical protein